MNSAISARLGDRGVRPRARRTEIALAPVRRAAGAGVGRTSCEDPATNPAATLARCRGLLPRNIRRRVVPVIGATSADAGGKTGGVGRNLRPATPGAISSSSSIRSIGVTSFCCCLQVRAFRASNADFSGTPSPLLAAPLRGHTPTEAAQRIAATEANLEFSLEISIRSVLAPFARVRRLPAAARALNFQTGMRRRKVASAASQFPVCFFFIRPSLPRAHPLGFRPKQLTGKRPRSHLVWTFVAGFTCLALPSFGLWVRHHQRAGSE